MGKSKPQFTETVICSHCGNKARMEVVAIYEQVQSHEMELGVGEMDWEAGRIWQLALCPACSGIILREFDYHTGMEPGTGIVDRRVLYPPVDKSLIGLPPEVDKAYQAALKVRQIDSNAFAVLLGRVLDRMCLDRGASGRSLYNRLISLAEKGEFPTRLAEMAHQLRQLRNIGAHADLGDLTPAEVPFLDDLCRAILEYVYTAPKLIEQVELRLQELEKNNSDIDKNGG